MSILIKFQIIFILCSVNCDDPRRHWHRWPLMERRGRNGRFEEPEQFDPQRRRLLGFREPNQRIQNDAIFMQIMAQFQPLNVAFQAQQNAPPPPPLPPPIQGARHRPPSPIIRPQPLPIAPPQGAQPMAPELWGGAPVDPNHNFIRQLEHGFGIDIGVERGGPAGGQQRQLGQIAAQSSRSPSPQNVAPPSPIAPPIRPMIPSPPTPNNGAPIPKSRSFPPTRNPNRHRRRGVSAPSRPRSKSPRIGNRKKRRAEFA